MSSPDRPHVTLGMVGLGRMGANLVRRAMADGHSAVVYDPMPAAVEGLVAEGATGTGSLADLVAALPANPITDPQPAGFEVAVLLGRDRR